MFYYGTDVKLRSFPGVRRGRPREEGESGVGVEGGEGDFCWHFIISLRFAPGFAVGE